MPTGSDFDAVRFDQKGNRGDYANHGDARNGEFTQVRPEFNIGKDLGSTIGLENGSTYPDPFGYSYDPNNREFSQDKSDKPMDLARESADSQSDFANLQEHLNNSLDVIGGRVAHDRTKPWEPPHGEGK